MALITPEKCFRLGGLQRSPVVTSSGTTASAEAGERRHVYNAGRPLCLAALIFPYTYLRIAYLVDSYLVLP